MESNDRWCRSAGTRLPARRRVVDTERLCGWDGRGRPTGARSDARCCTGGLSGIREKGPGLREDGSRGPDWRASGTPRAHGSGRCEDSAHHADDGRRGPPAARLRQHRQFVAAPRRGPHAGARRTASLGCGVCGHRAATVRRERGAGDRWWRIGIRVGASVVKRVSAAGARGSPPFGHGPNSSCSAGHRRGGDRPGRAAIRLAACREHGALRSLVAAPCRCPLRNRGAAVARRAAGARRFADRACTRPLVRSWSPRAEFCPSLWTGYGFCHQPPVGPWGFDALGQMGCFVRR